MVTSPCANYPPVTTDAAGEFIFGSARKMSLLAGKMKVTCDGFEPLTVEIDSPILVHALKPKQGISPATQTT